MSSDAESTTIGIYVGTYISAMCFLCGMNDFCSVGVIESLRAFRLLDTVDSAVVPVELYRIAIAKPDQVLSGNVYWAVSVSWLLEAIIEGIVRMFYCFRVWKVSGNKKLVSAIVFLDYSTFMLDYQNPTH
ncbi:hypothetical protein K435DRAFT_807004 [Dendrothele bispora CBS 962.96]|uniref:Uncharacterized protein n=1 Tax=Dendrothele bispora (strain CBS 962.96) TaxID=1314807 RepID=A0A4S8L6J2_DENBC|nr:hypothetical protein K435DRAFT_807004 [Dendrothele bispora CBS 962.96]